jgi:hypothetical protein
MFSCLFFKLKEKGDFTRINIHTVVDRNEKYRVTPITKHSFDLNSLFKEWLQYVDY